MGRRFHGPVYLASPAAAFDPGCPCPGAWLDHHGPLLSDFSHWQGRARLMLLALPVGAEDDHGLVFWGCEGAVRPTRVLAGLPQRPVLLSGVPRRWACSAPAMMSPP
jgi:hypothetical protein